MIPVRKVASKPKPSTKPPTRKGRQRKPTWAVSNLVVIIGLCAEVVVIQILWICLAASISTEEPSSRVCMFWFKIASAVLVNLLVWLAFFMILRVSCLFILYFIYVNKMIKKEVSVVGSRGFPFPLVPRFRPALRFQARNQHKITRFRWSCARCYWSCWCCCFS